MAKDLEKMVDELVEKFKERAEKMGIVLSDGEIDVNELAVLVEVCVRTVEDVSEVAKLNSLEKKALALKLFWRAVEQYELQTKIDDWLGIVAKKVHDWDIPRVPDWLIDRILTEQRIKEILTLVLSSLVDWIVGWLNKWGWGEASVAKKSASKKKKRRG